jgi:lincosamide nucleotidyltransferase A/C/D/E
VPNEPATDAVEVRGVLDALRAAGCRTWVAGGWGVDVLLGRQTRAHRDLDLAIELSGLEPALDALNARGYLVETDWLPVRVELHRPDRGWVDLHPLVFDERGDGLQMGFEGQVFHYPKAGFGHGRLDGVEVACLSRDLQLEFRRGYELRDVDRHDLALLRSLPAGP